MDDEALFGRSSHARRSCCRGGSKLPRGGKAVQHHSVSGVVSWLAQEPENQESDRGHGRRIALLAELLTRLEPDRDGLCEIKDAPAKGFRANG